MTPSKAKKELETLSKNRLAVDSAFEKQNNALCFLPHSVVHTGSPVDTNNPTDSWCQNRAKMIRKKSLTKVEHSQFDVLFPNLHRRKF